MENKILNMQQLKEYLGVSQNTAYNLAKRPDFPAIRISPRRIIVPVASLEKWLAENSERI